MSRKSLTKLQREYIDLYFSALLHMDYEGIIDEYLENSENSRNHFLFRLLFDFDLIFRRSQKPHFIEFYKLDESKFPSVSFDANLCSEYQMQWSKSKGCTSLDFPEDIEEFITYLDCLDKYYCYPTSDCEKKLKKANFLRILLSNITYPVSISSSSTAYRLTDTP